MDICFKIRFNFALFVLEYENVYFHVYSTQFACDNLISFCETGGRNQYFYFFLNYLFLRAYQNRLQLFKMLTAADQKVETYWTDTGNLSVGVQDNKRFTRLSLTNNDVTKMF